MSPFQITALTGDDVEGIVAVWNLSLVRDPITVTRFINAVVLDPDFDPVTGEGCYVAKKGDTVVGFVRSTVRMFPNYRLGLEPDDGWISVLFVHPEHRRQGIGSALLERALDFLKERRRKRVWACGNTGSAPGYIFPGVDVDAYAGGLAFFKAKGFVVDHEPYAMSGSLWEFDYAKSFEMVPARSEVLVQSITPRMVQPTLAFLAREFPGDWNAAARAKLATGAYDQFLIAIYEGEVVGYCQWDDEHFGPFGVKADLRGKQIGARLFIEALRRIKAADGRSVWFNWADEEARRFYARFGLQDKRHFAILRKELKV